MIISFHELCNAPRTGHHHKRIVTIGGFAKLADRPELVAAKHFWDALFLRHRPPSSLEGPLSLLIEITWPWNAGDSMKLRQTWEGRMPHSTKPDAENIAKTQIDSMARCGFFYNDSQIADLSIRKFRGDRPGVRVVLQPISVGAHSQELA